MSTDRLAPAKRTRASNRSEQNVNRSVGALTPGADANPLGRLSCLSLGRPHAIQSNRHQRRYLERRRHFLSPRRSSPMVSARFKDVCDEHGLLGAIFTDPDKVSYDYYPWEKGQDQQT